jgi:multimeric flavodoxin WrbA
MKNNKKVVGIVGSYRKDGVVDKAISEILSAASQNGAEVEKIYLVDKHIKFCTNCRECMQAPGTERGKCIHDDDMEALLHAIDTAHGLVIGAPVNFNNVTAITRTFMERCVGYVYWPWGIKKPQIRTPGVGRKVALVSASSAPARMGRTFSGAINALKYLANILGAHCIGELCIDKVNDKHMDLAEPMLKKATRLGRKLAR